MISASRQRHAPWVLHWDRMNYFQMPGVQLAVRPGLLPDDMEMTPAVIRHTQALSDAYRFYDVSYPLFDYAVLSIRLDKSVADTSRLCILGEGEREIDATYHDGWVMGKIRDLGMTYEIGYRKVLIHNK